MKKHMLKKNLSKLLILFPQTGPEKTQYTQWQKCLQATRTSQCERFRSGSWLSTTTFKAQKGVHVHHGPGADSTELP